MEGKKTGMLSGCLVWLLTFALLSMCLCPAGVMVGSFFSVLGVDWSARLVGPLLCPAGSSAHIENHSTMRMENGRWEPVQSFELVCTDPAGVQTNLGGSYALLLAGMFAVGGLVLAGLLALALAAPAGVLIGRLRRRGRE